MKLFTGGTIIAYDEHTKLLKIFRGGALLIKEDWIEKVYEESPPDPLPSGTEVIDCTNKIISPGFIDTHRHGWQTVFKNLGPDTTLADYVWRYSALVAQPLFAPDDVYISQKVGIYEALNAGTTTILDHAHHTWTREHAAAGYEASQDSGARVYFAYDFIDAPELPIQEALKHWRELNEAWKNGSDLCSLVVAYDKFGADPDGKNTQDVVALAKEANIQVFTSHHVGGPYNLSNTPAQLHKAGILDSDIPVVLSHGSFLTYSDAQLLRATNKHMSITVESEMHYGHTNPTAHLILDQASLGIDTHFTFSTDILTQARIWLQSTRSKMYADTLDRWQIPNSNPFSVEQAFLLATRNGGLAFGRKDLGVITEGAKADLLVWDGRSPSLLGWSDPIAAIVLHASVGDIEHVLVNGNFVKRDKKVDIDGYDEDVDKFLEAAKRIQDKLREKPIVPLEGNWPLGAPYGEQSKVDVQRRE
ncbi:amidohydrolase family protein [Lophiostoma macrostomum CBS 122681]|uniref:Amidohydrolase family protein n=1 Tax=Lophiostoma macrostomum CBS 122681 TaxID=1314788 RepID=A0A6A6TEV6_9PLEO|nr:amidohydrolase family protein [Lophiostoma macrostomum CBS 122681]